MRRAFVSLAAVLLLTAGCATYEQDVTPWAREQVGLSGSGGYEATGGWMDTLVGARVEGSNLYITLQVDRSERQAAENAKRLYVNTLRMSDNHPEWAEDVRFVIVEDGASVVITQESV